MSNKQSPRQGGRHESPKPNGLKLVVSFALVFLLIASRVRAEEYSNQKYSYPSPAIPAMAIATIHAAAQCHHRYRIDRFDYVVTFFQVEILAFLKHMRLVIDLNSIIVEKRKDDSGWRAFGILRVLKWRWRIVECIHIETPGVQTSNKCYIVT